MKSALICAVLLTAFCSTAEAKGCIKGAIVGGVVGHYAGHHGKLGALAGCVIGHHEAAKAAGNRPDPHSVPANSDRGRI